MQFCKRSISPLQPGSRECDSRKTVSRLTDCPLLFFASGCSGTANLRVRGHLGMRASVPPLTPLPMHMPHNSAQNIELTAAVADTFVLYSSLRHCKFDRQGRWDRRIPPICSCAIPTPFAMACSLTCEHIRWSRKRSRSPPETIPHNQSSVRKSALGSRRQEKAFAGISGSAGRLTIH